VRTEASETALREKAPGRRMLHLATHGFLLGEECPSFLAPPQAGSRSQVEDPLLLAGLALAGANHRQHASPGEDDGILTAEEIASLDLTGVEWVVLSGCDTGVGPVAGGEGVLGLRRAFRVAGAGSLILSLWKVEDQATREWMHELYRSRLEEGMDTAESVRAASVAVLRQRRKDGRSTHPFYWAAFVAEGDWR
jgi:CHAT domain-containing protein